MAAVSAGWTAIHSQKPMPPAAPPAGTPLLMTSFSALGAGTTPLAGAGSCGHDRTRRRHRACDRTIGQLQRERLHLADTSAPTGAEHRPGLETLEEAQPFIVDRDDDRLGIALGDRFEDLVVDDAGVVRQTDDAAQHLAAAPNPAVHAVIEDAVVDARRKIVAALGRPVFRAIDGLGLVELHRPDVGRGRVRLHVLAVVKNRDAEVGGAARV